MQQLAQRGATEDTATSGTGDKSHEVRRLLAAGRELSYEQRLSLLRLHARTEELWERREEKNTEALRK
jgi:hypothetical protein